MDTYARNNIFTHQDNDLVLGIVKGWVVAAGGVPENKNKTWTREIIAYSQMFKQLSLDSDNCLMLEQFFL